MDISIKLRFRIQKGRLAGFFLCLLLIGCQPAPQRSAGSLAFAEAQRALQANLTMKATEHLVIAIRQGHAGAVTQWLELTRATMGPLQQYQLLLDWLPVPLSVEHTAALGLWRDSTIFPPALDKGAAQVRCQLNIQPVLSTALSVNHWQQLQSGWTQSSFARLPICFLAPILVDSRDLRCSEQSNRRISCEVGVLSDVMQHSAAQILLVAAGRGYASFNNGWLQLPEHFSADLFRHEFSHALGFIDEYPLPAAVAAAECARTDILTNLLLKPEDTARYATHWALKEQEIQLTPVETCKAVGVQAWRPVQTDNHMQHYELPVPALYQKIMQQQLVKAHLLMPVQYYFAYLARQQKDMQRWQVLMRQAAAFGYPAAQDALQAAGISSTAR